MVGNYLSEIFFKFNLTYDNWASGNPAIINKMLILKIETKKGNNNKNKDFCCVWNRFT